MITEKISLPMTDKRCQCEHCKEILRQQERLAKWQKLNNKELSSVTTPWIAEDILHSAPLG